jgi:apolipoprotein N-acyltransferase
VAHTLPHERPSWGKGLALTAASAVLLASLGYENPALAWVAFTPLLVAVHGAAPGRGALLGLLAGWGFEVGTTLWFLGAGVSLPSYLLLTAVCALRFGVLGAVASGAWGPWRLIVVPGVWVLLEWLRLHQGPFSMGWGLIGYSQAPVVPTARLAALAGIYGVSFAILLVNVALAELSVLALRARAGHLVPARAAAPALAGLAGVLLAVVSQAGPGAHEAAGSNGALRVVAVQGGIYPSGSGDQRARQAVVERYRSMSRAALNGGADLVVWPEASFPASLPADASAVRLVAEIAAELETPLLLAASGADKNAPTRDAKRVAANSAFLVGPERKLLGRYDKVRLLPFNEYVPLRGLVTWPAWIVSDLVDAVAGTGWTGFEVDGYRFAVLICWENLFPHDFRAASEGSNFVVSLTNESFTTSPTAHRQLLDMNRMRAIESGVWIVRAATTAESALIAPTGELVERVTGPGGADTLGSFSEAFAPTPRTTLYRRAGDWLVGLQAVLLPLAVLRRRRHLRRAA